MMQIENQTITQDIYTYDTIISYIFGLQTESNEIISKPSFFSTFQNIF